LDFLRKIKTRIALSFSLLFLIVAIPAIIYALHQVNMFFEGMYLEQMKAAGLAISDIFVNLPSASYDSLAERISEITSSSVFLISENGQILARHLESESANGSEILSMPILTADTVMATERIKHKFITLGARRFLQVQAELPGGKKLLQVKSFGAVSMLMTRMREVIIWASFLGLVALVAVAFWVSANITRPIEELTLLAQKIRSGHLPDKTEVKSPDEVGDLADALNDIVDSLKQARERLSRLENMRRDFFANVSEQLKTPLLTIQEDVERLLQSHYDGETASRELLEKALAQSCSLERIIHALIEISKMEFGEATLEFRTLSLKHLIDSAETTFRKTAENKGLQFEIELPREAEGITAFGDERLLSLALGNLISNAIDFTDHGLVRIACRDEDDRIRIAVEDSGRGIAQDQLERIFERLYKVDSPQRKEMDRTGLGLAIAKHVIDAHDQKLEVESKLGVGSKFIFWLKKYDESDDGLLNLT
jgi:signal transduction histidine kinase